MLSAGPISSAPFAAFRPIGFAAVFARLEADGGLIGGDLGNAVHLRMPRVGSAVAEVHPPKLVLGVNLVPPVLEAVSDLPAGQFFAPFVFARLEAFAQTLPASFMTARLLEAPRAGNALAEVRAGTLTIAVRIDAPLLEAFASLGVASVVTRSVSLRAPRLEGTAYLPPPRINGVGLFDVPGFRARAEILGGRLPFDNVLPFARIEAAAEFPEGRLGDPDAEPSVIIIT